MASRQGTRNSEGFTQHPEETQLMTARQTPLRKLANAEDIAADFVFLASADARYITGEIPKVNGGLVVS